MGRLYWMLSVGLVGYLLLYLNYGISFPGQLSDKLLFWFWLTVTVGLVSSRFIKKGVKIYTVVLVGLLLLSLVPFGAPFSALVIFAVSKDAERQTGNYVLRYGIKSILARPFITVVEQKPFYEIERGQTESSIGSDGEYYEFDEFDNIQVVEEGDSLFATYTVGPMSEKFIVENMYQ